MTGQKPTADGDQSESRGRENAFRFSVIVPAPGLTPPSPVLEDVVMIAARRKDVEILVATGSNPSRQRNLAVALARGDILVFLDSDCRVKEGHFRRIDDHVKAGREFLGGPVLLHLPATAKETLFQSLFSHPLVTGPCSARYRSVGKLRESSDTNLILCNMAVRREKFLASGGFDERLYPNEENEWMVRLQSNHHVLWYDPDLAVHRPQRKSWREFACTMIGYGRGRTRQSQVSGRWDSRRQMPAAGIFLFVLAFLFRPRLTVLTGLLGWLGYAIVVRLTSPARISPVVALFAPTLPLLYAIGQIVGFFKGMGNQAHDEFGVYRWTEGALEEVGLASREVSI